MHGMVRTPGDMPAAFARALESGDLEELASLYAEQAATRTTAGRVVHGKERVRQELKGLLAREARFDGSVRWSVTVGDVALIIVDWTRRETDAEGKHERFSGTSTHVLRRRADGGWRFLIMNPNGTVGGAEPRSSERTEDEASPRGPAS